jgi:xylulokinase
MKYLLGVDVGSSAVKCSLVEIETGSCVANAFSPSTEMLIASPKMGFAEQDPLMWWDELINAMNLLKNEFRFNKSDVSAIGISYQMHGLVAVDRSGTPIIPSIIWCDGRSVEIGKKAFEEMGAAYCLSHYLNSPGNLTASKLKWVKENDPASYSRIHKIMLPGDFIAYKMTGEMRTTVSGLSEGVMWDVQAETLSTELLSYYGIDQKLICNTVPQFGEQGMLHAEAADLLGLQENTPITYRAGDQPNNAFSLNVLKPGEIAATAGTSGVVYGVIDTPSYDPLSRVNTFVHVNHTPEAKRYGVLLCINGTGILNSWLQKNAFNGLSYPEINKIASTAPIGSDGLQCYPFGNGAERVLENKDPGAMVKNLHFNRHDKAHLARAAQEGIAFALFYGIEIMVAMGLKISTVRAGKANMFLSEIFSEAFSNTSGASVELFNTDGAQGAARAAGLGAGFYKTANDCFGGLSVLKKIEPQYQLQEQYKEAYGRWKVGLDL